MKKIENFTNLYPVSKTLRFKAVPIGGYSKEDGTKIKGINECINLYNQKAEKTDKI